MTEQEICDLLQGIDQRRAMTEDARSRLRSRLGLEPALPVLISGKANRLGAIDDAVVDASVLADAGGPSLNRRPRKVAWMAAAVFVLVAGLGFAASGTRDGGDTSPVADQAAVATPTPAGSVTQPTVVAPASAAGSAFCKGVFADFVEAMGNWRGLDNWSRLVDSRHPEPHLPTFAEAVLVELSLIADDPAVVAEHEQFMSAIAELEEPKSNSTYRDEWRQPVEGVVSFLAQTVDSNRMAEVDLGECDSEALINAAAGP